MPSDLLLNSPVTFTQPGPECFLLWCSLSPGCVRVSSGCPLVCVEQVLCLFWVKTAVSSLQASSPDNQPHSLPWAAALVSQHDTWAGITYPKPTAGSPWPVLLSC